MEEKDSFFEGFYDTADDEHIRREKAKAREMRQSQWWKNECGKGVCYYCKKRIPPKELTMDHIVPIIRGGFTRKGNVVPCCKECNSKKRYLLPVEWQEELRKMNELGASAPAPVPKTDVQESNSEVKG